MNDSDNNKLTYVLTDNCVKQCSDKNEDVIEGNYNKIMYTDELSNNSESDAVYELSDSFHGYDFNNELIDTDDVMNSTGYSGDLNYYVGVSLISVITYIIIAYSSGVSLIELVDLEIPLIILLSLTICFLTFNWSRIYTYLLFTVILAVLIALSFNYSFMIMIILFSEMVIYSINMIITNKNDYTNT